MRKTPLKNYTGFKNSEGKLHRGRICLGKPYIEEREGGKARLCSKFRMDEREVILWYEVDEKWKKYFTAEYSDPFVLATVKLAMKHSYDICFEQPMSESLYYNLITYMVPVYARNIELFHEIDLYGETTGNIVATEGAAATGFSAGVDSFFTVLKHIGNEKCPGLNVSHLLLAVNGAASTGVCRELDVDWLDATRKKLMPYARQLGLELICVDSNVDSIYYEDCALDGDTIMSASFVYALRKLIKTYYWASAYPAEVLEFPDMNDGGFWEDLSVPYVSSEGLRFYHSGSETNRIGKVEFIADNPIAQAGLTPCGESDACNCGHCVKCLRTMAELNAIGKLDLFDKSFPVEDYKNHYTVRLAQELAKDHPPFTTDILDKMKENGIRVPVGSRLLIPLFSIVEIMRQHFRYNNRLRKLWYFLNLDERIDGRKVPDEERNRRVNGGYK